MTNFNCAFPAIQRAQGSGFLSEGSSSLTARIGDKYQIRLTRFIYKYMYFGLTSCVSNLYVQNYFFHKIIHYMYVSERFYHDTCMYVCVNLEITVVWDPNIFYVLKMLLKEN